MIILRVFGYTMSIINLVLYFALRSVVKYNGVAQLGLVALGLICIAISLKLRKQ